MIYRHTDEQIQYYFANGSLNQSAIKVLLKDGIQSFEVQRFDLMQKEELFYEEKQHFVIGSAIDCFITQGEEIYNNKYAYSKLKKKPPEKVMSIIQEVFSKAKEGKIEIEELKPFNVIDVNLKNYKKEIYDSCDSHQYYMNRRVPSEKPVALLDDKGKPIKNFAGKIIYGEDERTWEHDTRWEGILRDGTAQLYWSELIDSIGKQLLSETERDIVDRIIYSLLNHKHTKDIFDTTHPSNDNRAIDIIYQMPMYFEVNGVPCKILPDMIRIDHSLKKIMPIDIKTMGDYVLNFSKQLKIRRYDIQGSFYGHGISCNRETIGRLIGKDLQLYSISNTAFIVESTIKPETPMVYIMTDELTKVGYEGDSKYLKGYVQGVDLFKQWNSIDYSLERRFDNTNGKVWIDQFFEYNEVF